MKIFDIDKEFENLKNLEDENLKLINEEISLRNVFFDNLDTNKSVVLIGSGRTLDRRINRESIKKIFGDTISDDFYIVPINDKWIYCDEYNFSFCLDETFVYHYNEYNKDNNLMITPTHLLRLDYSTPGNISSIPYSYYKKQTEKILCTFKIGYCNIRNYIFNQNISNFKNVSCVTGGSTAINFFSENGFKNIYLIGFGGSGHTQLISDIPMAQTNSVWQGSTILRQNFKNRYQYEDNSPTNCEGSYEKFYSEIQSKYPELNLYFTPFF
jgi:hypothetical protein